MLRALAHPLRIELMERLALESSATASELAPLVGSTPSNCSFHLRKLAEAGFIERVPGHTGRHRPWRVVDVEQQWAVDPGDSAEVVRAKAALDSSFREWEFARIRRADLVENPLPWRGKLGTTGSTLFLTPDEANEVSAEIGAIVRRYLPRLFDPDSRPDGARPVRLYSTMYLVRSAETPIAASGPGSDASTDASIDSGTDSGTDA